MRAEPDLAPTYQGHKDLCLPLPRLAEVSFCTGASELKVLTDEALLESCGTRIAFTQRFGGTSEAPFDSLNLSCDVGDEKKAVAENRARLVEALAPGVAAELLVNPKQIHGDRILEFPVDEAVHQSLREEADGVVCAQRGLPVLLCFADCVPVISVAPTGEFAVTHAGWRGAIADIAGKGLRALAKMAHCETSYCNTYIGPHIGACCYEVDDALLERFVVEYGLACRAPQNHLDLTAAVTASLIAAGADQQRIVDVGACTSCSLEKYYSYRAQNGTCGRHSAFAVRMSSCT